MRHLLYSDFNIKWVNFYLCVVFLGQFITKLIIFLINFLLRRDVDVGLYFTLN